MKGEDERDGVCIVRQERRIVSLQFRREHACIPRVATFDSPLHYPRVRANAVDKFVDKFSSSYRHTHTHTYRHIAPFRLYLAWPEPGRLHPVLMAGVASCLKMGPRHPRTASCLLKRKYGRLRSVYIRAGPVYIRRINLPLVRRNGRRCINSRCRRACRHG